MRFLVLALCVCAASAVPAWQSAKSVGKAVVAAPVVAAKAVAAAPVAAARAVASAGEAANAETLRFESDVNAEGYNYAYETSNQISASASGSLKNAEDGQVLTSQGEFQYVSPEGQAVRLTYVADENGYQPQGDVLPTPHPIPEAIQRAIQYIEAHPPQP